MSETYVDGRNLKTLIEIAEKKLETFQKELADNKKLLADLENRKNSEPVFLKLETCKHCPHLSVKRMYTEDSWEHAFDWFCSNHNNEKIAGYIEWERDEPKIIPEWCPLRKK